MEEIEYLKSELRKYEIQLKVIEKKYDKMEKMLDDKRESKRFIKLMAKALYIQGKLSVLDGGFEHKRDISYIG